jgi:hypothetical protein
MRIAGMTLAGLLAFGHAAAQQFVPPKSGESGGGTRVGLFGFGARAGFDFEGSGQLVVGATLDAGDVFTSHVRLRPSAEVGVFNGPNTYITSLEGLWRFTKDDDVATPYAGVGFSIAGHEDCGADADCPALWANVVVGFELRYRSTFNWLLEYHGMDWLRRHRFYIGLTTRRGN